MNRKPINEASSQVLRLSHAALLRAAQRARERARNTQTRLVVSRHGKVIRLDVTAAGVAETPAGYRHDR